MPYLYMNLASSGFNVRHFEVEALIELIHGFCKLAILGLLSVL